MMKHIILIAVAMVVLMGMLACKGAKNVTEVVKKPAPTGRLVGFHYVEHGTMAQPNFEYMLRRDSGKVSLYVFRPWIDEGWGDTVVVADDVIDHVEKLIKDNNLQNYQDHYSPNMQVLDGYSWSYQAEFDDDVTLSSGGSNAGPGDGTLKTIGNYLDSCYVMVKVIKRNE